MPTEHDDVDPAGAAQALAMGAALLDVREAEEFAAGRAPQAQHVPLHSLPDRIDEIPGDQLIVCVCRSGHRSALARDYLRSQGFTATNLSGGMAAWAAAGLPLEGDGGPPTIA